MTPNDLRQNHPDPEALVGYHAETLSEAERGRVRRHLIGCRECASAVLDMARFPEIDPPPGSLPMTSADVSRNWRRLQERLREEAPATSHEPRDPSEGRPPWWAFLFPAPRFAYALVVVLLVTNIATLMRQGGPSPNIQSATLALDGAPGERAGSEPITLGPDSRGLYLLLPLAENGDTFRLEIIPESGGKPIRETLTRDPKGRLSIVLPRADLRSGRYQARFRRPEGDQVVASYSFELKIP